MIKFDVVSTPVGPCTVQMEEGRVVGLALGRRKVAGAVPARLGAARAALARWFSGRPADVPLQVEGSPFARRVYEVVRGIPAGQTRTYAQVARSAGRPGAARAVGNVMGRNRICLFIP